MKKVLLDGEYIYINDERVEMEETGVYIPSEKDFMEDDTKEISIVNDIINLEDTITNLWEA